MKLTEAQYWERRENYEGYCLNCKEFTRDSDTEPDAENYPCDQCGSDSVVGVETALLDNLFEIVEEEELEE